MMYVESIKNNKNYLEEYVILCNYEWGTNKITNIEEKIDNIINGNKVIEVLGLFDDDKMVGFISLFKYDGDERHDLFPWYATMCVKKEYRGRGYSKILNNALLEKARELGYKKIYLKSELKNYYEKFGAKYMSLLSNGEKLYYINL